MRALEIYLQKKRFFVLITVSYSFQASDIENIHKKNCPNYRTNQIQLSCDGLHESKSTSTSIDVYSWKFKHCKQIYPHKLVRPLSSQKLDNRRHLGDVLTDINDNHLRIMQFIADKLKRSDAKDCKGHSSWYPCEYCYAKGVKVDVTNNGPAKKKIEQQIALVQEKIDQCESDEMTSQTAQKIDNLNCLKSELQKSLNALKKKSNILWPYSTMHGGESRTRNSIMAILDRIESGEQLTLDDTKGILRRSLLLDVPDFNFIYDSPAEYLHCACLGVIKRLVEVTFDVGKKRKRVTKTKLISPSKFNKLLMTVKMFKEFSRRARSLDFAVYKGQEFRNLLLFHFPLVLQCFEQNAKEITLWLNFAFMFRSSVIPSEEYSNISLALVQECCENFYKLFEELYGPENCTYNMHTFCSHLLEIRTHGPLTETSAFIFESFYGEIRRSFVPGTTAPLKQILKKILLKRNLSNHVCKNDIFITNYDTSLESNKLIYCYKNNKYIIYEITDIDGDMLLCNKVGQYPVSFPETPNITWSKVGVFKKGGVSSEITQINSSEISGKALNVGPYLITCPMNVLHEK